jgi:hypothetical protein
VQHIKYVDISIPIDGILPPTPSIKSAIEENMFNYFFNTSIAKDTMICMQ